MKYKLPLALFVAALALSVSAGAAHAGTTALTGWAWSSNVGWISFNSANSGAGAGSYSVTISTTTSNPSLGQFGGYAWSPYIGWISFNASDIVSCPTSDINYDQIFSQGGSGAPLPAGVTNICTPRVNFNTGKVSGWARILSMEGQDGGGWLHLSGTNHVSPDFGTFSSGGNNYQKGGVTYTPSTGALGGLAWESSAVGWVSFDAGSQISGGPCTGSSCGVCLGDCGTVTGTQIVTASCSFALGTTMPLPPTGGPVTFIASASGGNGVYQYSFNSGAYSSTRSTSVTYGSGGGPSPTVTAEDTSPTPNVSAPVVCPAVSVTGTNTGSCSQPAHTNLCTNSSNTDVPSGTPTPTPYASQAACPASAGYCQYYCAPGYALHGGICSRSNETEI